MNSVIRCAGVGATILCAALIAVHFARSQGATSLLQSQGKERARVVLSKSLSKLDGDRVKVVVMEVSYGPGDASLPHSHPCGVIGYVVEGAIRTQVQGEPETTYKAGESFYEAPHGIHLVSANASSTESAKLIAYFICDSDSPLSVGAPEIHTPKR